MTREARATKGKDGAAEGCGGGPGGQRTLGGSTGRTGLGRRPQPAGEDSVAWRLEHRARAELGAEDRQAAAAGEGNGAAQLGVEGEGSAAWSTGPVGGNRKGVQIAGEERQMFVNKEGKIMERFLGIEHITLCTSVALKETVIGLLAKHDIPISRLHG